ncbi:AAA family ATPase [Microlunatus sp. GCM10028923]|uniref:AAA family ATPase n=1 Tax=Microlunatus sp. GCM10028923 TaxID=3273400 RepID=UPI0036155C33
MGEPDLGTGGRVIVITGAMAAGKSTVAELLAGRLPCSVHIRGDVFRKMMVNGRADMTPQPTSAALDQLQLRYELAAHTADRFADQGFDAIVQDVIIGPDLAGFIDQIQTKQRYLVVLSPTVSALEIREAQRAKDGYGSFSPNQLDELLRRETARIGYWLDSSVQTPDETVDDILTNLDQAAV